MKKMMMMRMRMAVVRLCRNRFKKRKSQRREKQGKPINMKRRRNKGMMMMVKGCGTRIHRTTNMMKRMSIYWRMLPNTINLE